MTAYSFGRSDAAFENFAEERPVRDFAMIDDGKGASYVARLLKVDRATLFRALNNGFREQRNSELRAWLDAAAKRFTDLRMASTPQAWPSFSPRVFFAFKARRRAIRDHPALERVSRKR
jgi:hypothetical protein